MADTTTKKPRARKPAAPKVSVQEDTVTETVPEDAEPKPKRLAAMTQVDRAIAFVAAHGEDGVPLSKIAEHLGISYRQGHNVTWVLEGGPGNGKGTKEHRDTHGGSWPVLAERTAPKVATYRVTERGSKFIAEQGIEVPSLETADTSA